MPWPFSIQRPNLKRREPADLPELQLEAFHCVLFAAVVCGHHNTVETLLQHRNPHKTAPLLPSCIRFEFRRGASIESYKDVSVMYGKQPEEPISVLSAWPMAGSAFISHSILMNIYGVEAGA